ncbi:hypothetical protein EXS70_02115 [Candidatus Peribacteria bacterium]|nr:hypothetical protein [Candidatus Peribacteria bacterium]
MRCLLVGNYGVDNLGDEALKEYFLKAFPDVQWTVLSASPGDGEVPRLPFGVRSLLTTPWLHTLWAYVRCRAVVFGGGSLFTDVESSKACLLWWWHSFVARLLRKRVVLAFQGIGPVTTGVGEWCAKSAISHAAFISVRDPESAQRARGWARARVIISFDPVLSLIPDAARNTAGNLLTVIPRGNADESFRSIVLSAAERHSTKAVNIVSLDPGSVSEQILCRSLCEKIGPRCSIKSASSIDELSAALADTALVITARYHGAVAALGLHIPFEAVPQAPGDKLDVLRSLQADGSEPLRAAVRVGEEELRKYINML